MARQHRLVDQYSEPVARDLVVLIAKPELCSVREKMLIQRLLWYKPDADAHRGYGTLVLVSYEDLKKIMGDAPFDYFTELPDVGIKELKAVMRIPFSLYRWSNDGFYHA